jgi:FAD synthetase
MKGGQFGYGSASLSLTISRYTSLGSTYNTFPNPALLEPGCETTAPGLDAAPSPPPGAIAAELPIQVGHADTPVGTSTPVGLGGAGALPVKRYRPAYELLDDALERAGRGK